MSKLPDALLILVALSVASMGVWQNGLVRDDTTFLQAHDRDVSVAAVGELLAQGFFPEAGGTDAYYYRPLTRYLFRLENLIFRGGVAGYHFCSLLLYFLLLLTLNAVLRPWVASRFARLVALLWVGLHPATHSIWVFMTGTDTLPLIFMGVAVLWARREGALLAVLAGISLLLGCFCKELGVLGFPIVGMLLIVSRRWRDVAWFAFVGVAGLLLYFTLRSFAVTTPNIVSTGSLQPLALALLRESFWTPVLALVRPDLCQQENFIRAHFPGDGIFLAIAMVCWGAVAWGLWKGRSRKGLGVVALFALFWALAIPNIRESLELSTPVQRAHVLYLPDHLLWVPLLCALVPLVSKLSGLSAGRWLVGALAGATIVVGAVKTREWRDEESLFRAVLRRQPMISRPYKILAFRLAEKGRLPEAMEILEGAQSLGFRNSELYHLSSMVAEGLKDSRAQGWMKDGARTAIGESEVEIPDLLRAQDGRRRAHEYLELKKRMFPAEPWFAAEQEKYR